jgi:nitrite reductase/ring-hydroxylating ferredoxin subunit
MPVLAVRLQGRLYAIAAVCSHAGGPLDEGQLNGTRVTCPWHGSVFCVTSGQVRGGPATFSQPRFAVREEEGRVDLKVAAPPH